MKLFKDIISRILIFFLLFNLVPFWINNTNANDLDWTANLDLSLTSPANLSTIIWDNFNISFSLKNELSSEWPAFKVWYVVNLPSWINFVSSSLWNPSKTISTQNSTTTLVFETSDVILEWNSKNQSIVLSWNPWVWTTKDIKILAYANDNIYGRWAVPTWAPPSTLSWWVDISWWWADPVINFPDNINWTTDLSIYSFETTSISNIPFDISKSESWWPLIWDIVTTTLSINWNSIWDLKHFHLQDTIPNNREFIWLTQTGVNIWWIDVVYNYPNSWEITLDFTDINVATWTNQSIKYQTRIISHEVLNYTWWIAIFDSWAVIDNWYSSINVMQMHTWWLAVNWTWYLNPSWNNWSVDIDVDSSTLPSSKSFNIFPSFAKFTKSVDNSTAVIWDILNYSLDFETANNVSFITSWSWTFIEDILPDWIVFSWTISSSITSGSWTSLTFIWASIQTNWDTILTWKLNSWSIESNSIWKIVYQAVVDWNFEWAWDTQFENTESLINNATLTATIWDSWESWDWWYTDPSIIWNKYTYNSSSSIKAPIPQIETHLITIQTPDGTIYDNTNYNSWVLVPVWSSLEFVMSMDFPNVPFINAFLQNALPLLTWHNENVYDISFQTNKWLFDVYWNIVKYNTNDKSSWLADNSFNSWSLILSWSLIPNSSWINISDPNNINFDLWSWDWNKIFSIKFKVDILPNAPETIPENWLHPLLDVSLWNFENDQFIKQASLLDEFNFQISLPYLKISKTSSGTNITAWKSVDYSIKIENSWKASAFAENIIDILPENTDLVSYNITFSWWWVVPASSITQSWSQLNIIFNTWAISPNRSVIPSSSTIIVDYSISPNPNFVIKAWDIRTNNISLDYYSSSWSLSNWVNNYWPITDSSDFTVWWPSIERNIISSSEPDTSWNDLLIWEEVTFETIISLSWWTYQNSSYNETHYSNLEFLTWSVVSTWTWLTFSSWTGFIWDTVNFWDIINSNTWSTQNIVINTTYRVNTSSTSWNKSNNWYFYYSWTNINKSKNVDVFIPNLTISKTISPIIWDAWDIVSYNISVSNWNSTAPAYDLRITDILPNGISFISWSLNLWSFSWSENDLLYWSWLILDELLNWTPKSFSFSWILDDYVIPSDTYTNTAFVTYDSLDDDDSIYEKNYSKSNWANVTITDISITHDLYNTSLWDTLSWKFNSSLEDLSIWETAYFKTIIQIPESSFTWFIVTQDLPSWLKFLSWSKWTDTIWSHSLSNITISPDNKLTFDLWYVINTWSWITSITLLSEAVVLDNTSNNAWNTKQSLVSAYYASNNKTANDSLDIVEPNLTISKSYSPNSWDWWDSILTTITISNSWSSPAYDLSWSDLIPNKTTTWIWYLANSNTWVLNPWNSISYTYNTILDSSVLAWEILTWTASINYSSYPWVPVEWERSYSWSDTDSITITVSSWLQAILETNSDVSIWDISNYTIKTPVLEWNTPSLLITTTIPAWITINSWSIIISSSWAISYSWWVIQTILPDQNSITSWESQIITWLFTDIVNTDNNNSTVENIVINYDTIVLNTNDNNSLNTKIHNASANYNSWAIIKTASTSPITIREPNIVLDITNNYVSWNNFEYIFNITNNWNATAYDIDLTNILPTWISFSWTQLITNSWWFVNLSKSWDNFTIDSLSVNTWNPLTFKISWVISDLIPVTTNLTLTWNIIYTSKAWNYSQIVSNSLNSERNWLWWINDYSDSDNSSLVVNRAILDEDIWVVDLNWWDWLRWDIFEYTITLTNTWTQDLNWIPVNIDIPWSFTWFSVQSIPAWSTDNSTLTWWLNSAWYLNIIWIDIPVWQSRTIIYRVTAKNDITDLTTISTTANVWNPVEWWIWWTPSIWIQIIAPDILSTITEIDDNWWSLYKDELVTHNINIQNNWSSTWTNLVSTINFSTWFTYQSWSLLFSSWSKINTWSIIIDTINNNITFTILNIWSWATETITFKTKATANIWDTITTSMTWVIDEWITINPISNILTIVSIPVSSWWWGWYSSRPDSCPDWDYSSSRYDKDCWEKPIDKTEEWNKEKDITKTDNSEKEKIKNPTKEDYSLYIDSINNLYKDYLDKKSKIDQIIKLENTPWEGLDIYPKVLPKTWTDILSRVKKIKDNRLVLDIPENVWKLAWNYNEDINFWKKWLPEIDQYRNEYLVIPSNWLVVPINNVEEWNTDYNNLISWREINVNNYLKDWVLSYPGTSKNSYWWVWNIVIFWHSSYWKNDEWRYKTHFQKIIELDSWEQVWLYKKELNWNFIRYRYLVEKSYNTISTDVEVLSPWIWQNLTLFTCTPIWWIAWRWIIKAKYIDEEKTELESYIYWNKIDTKLRQRLDLFIFELSKMNIEKRNELILKLYKWLLQKENSSNNKYLLEIIYYFKLKLSVLYNS